MITSIQRVKGLGVFRDYTAPNGLPAFERLNVVYGENGSGKTTLSRLFCALENGAHIDHPKLDFTLTYEGGQHKSGQKFHRKVRVFNSDYVDENIGQFDGPIKHILILGQENKELAAQMVAEQATHALRLKGIEEAVGAEKKLETARGKIFTAIASTISEATSGSTARNYRKPNAETAFAKLVEFKELDEVSLAANRATVRQEQMDPVSTFVMPSLPDLSGHERPLPELVAISAALTNSITQRSAQSSALQRLLDAPDIAMWVETGLDIHREHRSKNCEFCDQPLPGDRLERLAEHFSIEDQQLKAEIETALDSIDSARAAAGRIAFPDRSSLYGELRPDYDIALVVFQTANAALVETVGQMRTTLIEKLARRTTAYTDEIAYDPTAFFDAVGAINAILERQGTKTSAFDLEKNNAVEAIECHYLASVVTEVAELDQKIATERDKGSQLLNGSADFADLRSVAELVTSIAEKQATVSSAHAGGADLTEHLKKFLGRTELKFQNGTSGYAVFRRDKPAKRLSEGEKTAIAFIHFIVQLGDQDFDPKEGLIVIDDPISSLDASAIYQAFSFLKNAVKDAKQIFVLTHNFDFLKLVLSWAKRGFKKQAKYYMVVCIESEGYRDAVIRNLDDLLINHSSEYQFLFKTLHQFKSDGTILSCYNIPNMARKVLETFLEFHVPSNDDIYRQLENVKFDEHKKTAIYKFTNDLSHYTGKGFDPALVAETQKNTTFLLEMIKDAAPDHYNGLVAISS
jgi:wobble nucleotide-excising tRNase